MRASGEARLPWKIATGQNATVASDLQHDKRKSSQQKGEGEAAEKGGGARPAK